MRKLSEGPWTWDAGSLQPTHVGLQETVGRDPEEVAASFTGSENWFLSPDLEAWNVYGVDCIRKALTRISKTMTTHRDYKVTNLTRVATVKIQAHGQSGRRRLKDSAALYKRGSWCFLELFIQHIPDCTILHFSTECPSFSSAIPRGFQAFIIIRKDRSVGLIFGIAGGEIHCMKMENGNADCYCKSSKFACL